MVGRRLVTGRRDGGAAGGEAPGRPGAHPLWLPAGKTGFGGSRDKASNVWFTLHSGLRLTKDGNANANAGTAYDPGNSSVSTDQRAVADAGFLELVRLCIYAPDNPVIHNNIEITDKAISYTTPTGQFWHRYTGDGYGERPDGSQWEMDLPPGSRQIFGRLWPLLTDERGEYELANGDLRLCEAPPA